MPSDDAALCHEAVSRWHHLLREGALPDDDPGLEQLRGLRIYGEQRVMQVVRPHFLTPARFESEALACGLVARALAKVCASIREDHEILDELGVHGHERDLILIDPGFENPDVFDRFDAFASKRLGFVEVQGAAPGGVGYVDAAARAFQAMAIHERFSEEFDIEPLLVAEPLRESMLQAWRDFGGSGDPSIGIVDWDDAPLMPEFELIRDDLVAAGLDVTICDPRQLRLEGGRVHGPAGVIDLVYRRLTIMDCLARPDEVSSLVTAAREGAVCLINPFASDLMGHKSIFDLLTDEERDFGLTATERNAVRNHVPWTRILVADADPRDHRTVGRDEVVEHRTSLVLKPVHELGGHGVTLGWETEPREWEELVSRAVADGHLVQRRIQAHREPWPWDAPEFPLRELYVDNDPYMFRGRMGGVLARLSGSGITNLTSGGSLTSTFLVRPR
ncbi:MAG: hypothetical protein ACEQSX_16970 [Baekduiaceae bacterium]